MFKHRYRWDMAPDVHGPGVYAFFATDPTALAPIELGLDNLVYIGMAKRSLASRNHFAHPDSGRSTLRRSLGAVLKDKLGLTAVPRNRGKSEKDFDYYRFADNGESILTEWMRKTLLIALEPLNYNIDATESKLITELQPPFCLNKWRNPQGALIEELRTRCKAEAREGFIVGRRLPARLTNRSPQISARTSKGPETGARMITVVEIANQLGLDQKNARARLRREKKMNGRCNWHTHNQRWEFEIDSLEYREVMSILSK